MEMASGTEFPSLAEEKSNDRISHPYPVEDWIDLRYGHSVGTKRWLYFKRKYAWERILGCLLLIPAYPLILFLCVLVRMHSKGDALYRQTRVGYRGRPFEIIKIRTMRCDAEADGQARWCVKGDARITPLGRIIRKLHLDELPQLMNVAQGEMSLVGPRPERPVFVDKLKLLIPGYERRLAVMPGITGLAQINLPPDEKFDDVQKKLLLDLRYISEACFWLDFRMLLASSVRLIGVPGVVVTQLLGLHRPIPVLNDQERSSSSADSRFLAEQHVRRSSKNLLKRPLQRIQFATEQTASPSGSKMRLADSIPNALTVDVEEYFQVSGFEHRISRADWDSFPSRVEASTNKLLRLFQEKGVYGTFFVLGWVADKYPWLIKNLADAGHEIGCHSFDHRLIYEMTPGEFREDLIRSRDAIHRACGIDVKCYRAPSFSITARSLWAIDTLVEEGFAIDSSIFPMQHDRYGMPDSIPDIHYRSSSNCELMEFPPSVWQSNFGKIPVGGGYFRLMPYWMTHKAIQGVRKAGRPAMFYIHPWEIDPDQPRISNVGWKNGFRHYVGQTSTMEKLRRLLDNHRFAPVSEVLSYGLMSNIEIEESYIATP